MRQDNDNRWVGVGGGVVLKKRMQLDPGGKWQVTERRKLEPLWHHCDRTAALKDDGRPDGITHQTFIIGGAVTAMA